MLCGDLKQVMVTICGCGMGGDGGTVISNLCGLNASRFFTSLGAVAASASISDNGGNGSKEFRWWSIHARAQFLTFSL